MPDLENDNEQVNDQSVVYEGFPFISNVDNYVQTELTYRAENRNRAATPYIKITPGFSSNSTPGGKIVMKGIEAPNDRDPSTYKFNELYRPDAFYRPLAGVKNVTVDYKNAYGSTRKATISWVCHSVEDLERLSPYFLNPGYTVLIEWGWSDMAKAMITNDPGIKLDNAFRYGKAGQRFTNGNYDCMLGVTTNYSFSMNRDGGFECTTEVISAGYLMEGMTIPNQFTTDSTDARKRFLMSPAGGGLNEDQANEQVKNETELKESTEDARVETLQYFLTERLHTKIKADKDIYNNANNVYDDYFIYNPIEGHEDDSLANAYISENIDDDKKTIDDVKVVTPDKTELVYQQKEILGSWVDPFSGLLVLTTDYIDDPSKPKVLKTTKGTQKEIETIVRPAQYASWGYIEDEILNPHINIATSNSKKTYFKFDSRNSKIAMHKNLRTTDLGVCLIPYDGARVPDIRRGETNDDTYNYGYPRRILINLDYFRETMLNATTVMEGVLAIWSGINDACVNYWNFKLKTTDQFYDDTDRQEQLKDSDRINQIVPKTNVYVTAEPMTLQSSRELAPDENESALNKYSIIDINYADKVVGKNKIEDGNVYIFRTKGFSIQGSENKFTSVVRNINFQSKLSSQAALNVFYSAQNSDGKVMGTPQTNTFRSLYDFTIGEATNNILKDTFALRPLKIDSPKMDNVDGVPLREPGTTTELVLQEQSPYGETLQRFLPIANGDIKPKRFVYDVSIPSKKEFIHLTGIEGMKIAVLLNDPPHPAINSTALVPLDCDVELEGISGLRIGNVFTIDHLPSIYQKKGVFQIIGITDTVDKNSWVTKLKSQFRVFNDVKYKPLSAVPKSSRNVSNIPIGNITPDELVFYNKKQIHLKTTDEVVDFEALKTKNKNLREVLLNANAYSMKYFNKVVTVTDIHRKREESIANPGSKHLTWEGADLRSDKYTAAERVNFEAYLKTQADYVLYHFGTGWHFHIEVRA